MAITVEFALGGDDRGLCEFESNSFVSLLPGVGGDNAAEPLRLLILDGELVSLEVGLGTRAGLAADTGAIFLEFLGLPTS
jgi:hypothetical protein